uniref:Uncharacterized protein n=1 Tax=Solanum tuberosum TaxID=4113 RepID=M1DXG7_SOLTU
MAGTPPLTQHFVHPSVSFLSTAAPSATPNYEKPTLAPGQKDKLSRVMIEPDGSSKSGWGIHKDRVYGRGSQNHVRRLQLGLQGIRSSCQAEALDAVQIAAMLAQIAQLTSALAESEWRRVAKQECMSTTIQQIKEQVMNLTR